MAYLRATKKVLSRLPHSDLHEIEPNETALGDWYVNRIVVHRRPLLVLVSSMSLLPIVVPARDIRNLPGRLSNMVGARLERLGVDVTLIDAEVRTLDPVHVAPTANRSVLGILTDFCRSLPYYLATHVWGEQELFEAESKRAETPCYASRKYEDTVWPAQMAVELLRRRWSDGPVDDGVWNRSQ